MELFLVQVDLQMIKEIIDHFPESEFTLKDIVKVRSETRDVEDAITRLERKAAKRLKREEPRGHDVSSHRHTKHTHAERNEKFNNVHSDSTLSDADASADQTTSRKPKRTVLSKGRDDAAAADADDSSSGSNFSKRKSSGGAPTEYKVPSGNTGGRYYHTINSQQLSDQDLYGVSPEGSQTNGVTQHDVDVHRRTFSQAGSSYASKQLTGHSTVSQGGSRYELNERYTTFPPSGSLSEANQHYHRRYRTEPQTGPSHYSNTESRSQRRMPYAGRPLYPDGTKDRMDSAMTTSGSASGSTAGSAAHHETVTPLHLTRYSSEPFAGSSRDYRRRHAAITQSNTVPPSNKVIFSDTNGYHSKSPSRTETGMLGSASGNTRYANLTNSYTGQKFGSNESVERMSTKESARRHDDRDAKYGPTGTSSSEPMEMEQTEYSRASRNDAISLYNESTEGTHGKTTVQSGVTDLNATLQQQLIIDSNVHSAGKESKQSGSTSSEHRRQHGSEPVAGAPEVTGSRAGTTGGAQPTRLLYQLENNVTTKEATSKSAFSAADLKDHSAAKTEPKGSSPGPSRRTSAPQENDPHIEVSRERSFLEKDTKGAATCELCGSQGTIICRKCLRIVCIECMKVYAKDLCEATKGQHVFCSSQEAANTDEACGNGDKFKDWSCSRCTYLNAPECKICVICGATRGIGVVESAKQGSKVCSNCTLHNEETEVLCVACHSQLTKSATVV